MEYNTELLTREELEQLTNGLTFYVSVRPNEGSDILTVSSSDLRYTFEVPKKELYEKAPQELLGIIFERREWFQEPLPSPRYRDRSLEEAAKAARPCADGGPPSIEPVFVRLAASKRINDSCTETE